MSGVWLIEWQYKTGGSEWGPNAWEPDHNAGMWWTQDAAEHRMAERITETGGKQSPYVFRVRLYAPANGGDPVTGQAERILRTVVGDAEYASGGQRDE